MSKIWSATIKKASGGVAGFALVLCIVMAVNVVLGNFNLRTDLTGEKLYTLSGGTRNVLKKLDQDVTLKFFFNSSSAEIPVGIKNFARRVEDLLREYELAADGKIIIEKYDPKPDSDAEDWAQRYGVSGQPLGLVGPMLYMGLVAEAGDMHATIPVLDPAAEELMEYNITRMILRVADPRKRVVGVMSSLPVLGLPGVPPFTMPGEERREPRPAWVLFQAIMEDYEVRKIETDAETIDMDVGVLILVHPKDLPDGTLYAIDQFVLRGGQLLVFLDPMCLAEVESSPGAQPFDMPGASNLDRLLTAWGVTFDSGKIVADMEAITRVRGAGNAIEESPVWLSLHKRHLNSKDILTSRLESLMMPFAGSLSMQGAKDVAVTPLVSSSETSSMVESMMARMGSDPIRREFKSGLRRLDLAIRIQGKLKTAFPDGKPKDEKNDAADKAESNDTADEAGKKEQEQASTGLKESSDKSTVILVGDTDIIYDRFCVQEINFLGARTYQPINDNMNFFANAVDQMAGGSDLVAIRSRGKTDRPFEVVINLETKAQDQWLQREKALQQKLEEAQRRLNELQSRKDETQQFILSPEQKGEIEKFRKEEMETKKELKLVRRKLREDIERLGMWIKLANILLMPAVVCMAGVGFGLYRRLRSQS